MTMKKRKANVSIIGGADGPTSVFVAGRNRRRFSDSVCTAFNKYKRNRISKKITAGTHTLEEVVAYAMRKYKLTERAKSKRSYIEKRKELKESLIIQHYPELLGDLGNISRPDVSDEAAIRAFIQKIEERSRRAAELPEDIIPMDLHVYELVVGGDSLELEIDYKWNLFSISYSGNKKLMKQFAKISRDLYCYYGVSEEDIKNKTKRYSTLLTVLSS